MASRISPMPAWTWKMFGAPPAAMPEIDHKVLVHCWIPWILRIALHSYHSDLYRCMLKSLQPIHPSIKAFWILAFVIISIRSFWWIKFYSLEGFTLLGSPSGGNRSSKAFPFVIFWRLLALQVPSCCFRQLGGSRWYAWSIWFSIALFGAAVSWWTCRCWCCSRVVILWTRSLCILFIFCFLLDCIPAFRQLLEKLQTLTGFSTLGCYRFTPFAFAGRFLKSAWHFLLFLNIFCGPWSHIQVSTCDHESH